MQAAARDCGAAQVHFWRDSAVGLLWTALTAGATLVIPPDQLFHQPELLAPALQSITMMHAAPSAMSIVLESTPLPDSLRWPDGRYFMV